MGSHFLVCVARLVTRNNRTEEGEIANGAYTNGEFKQTVLVGAVAAAAH